MTTKSHIILMQSHALSFTRRIQHAQVLYLLSLLLFMTFSIKTKICITSSADTLQATATDRGIGHENLVVVTIRFRLRTTIDSTVRVRTLELGGRHRDAATGESACK